MTDLIKEFRELLANTTQGEITLDVEQVDVDDFILGLTIDGELIYDVADMDETLLYFFCKAHNDLPKILDTLEQAALNVEASQKAARAYCDELARYKKALEVCREQRILFAAIGYDPTQPEFLNHLIEEKDIAIDQILEGEVEE